MRPCPECGGAKTLEIDPSKPDVLVLWETHKKGCSWSPLITPTEMRWAMREVPRTDAPPLPSDPVKP